MLAEQKNVRVDRPKPEERDRESSLFRRVIDKHACFLDRDLVQTRDYSRFKYTCT